MKRVLVLVFLSLVSLSALAQLRIAVGPKVGLNFATLSSDVGGFGGTVYSGRTGMMFGAIVDLAFGHMFGVQVEPTFVMKGGSTVSVFGGSQTKALSYFEFPIAFKVRWMEGRFVPFSFFGPSIGFNVSASLKQDAAQGGFGQAQDQDIGPQTSGADFGLLFGSGFEFRPNSSFGIFLDTRYSFGLSNVLNTAQQNLGFGATGASEKNRGFQILTGILFYLGK
jgi:hypothetical protein